MHFSKNGNDQGPCFEVEKEKLDGKALFPHILTKNTEFECNFGAKVGTGKELPLFTVPSTGIV